MARSGTWCSRARTGRVTLYPALGLRARFGERWESSDTSTPLFGRDREMVLLLDAWVRAQAGDGQLVTLMGDAGVGKSRLVAEAIDRLAANSAVRVVRARCLSYGQEISLWLIADILRSFFDIVQSDGSNEIRKKLSEALTAHASRWDAATRAEAVDVLGEVLGLPAGKSPGAQSDAQARRQALIRSLRLLLGALSD